MSSGGDNYNYGDPNMPKIDLYGGSNIDLRSVAPLYGVASDEEPDYLDYDIKGRGTVEKMFLYSGTSYLTGEFTTVMCLSLTLLTYDLPTYLPPF